MVRIRLIDQDFAQQCLLEHLVESDYEFLGDHKTIIDKAIVFMGYKDGNVAGYVWFYPVDDYGTWVVHMSVLERYRSRFLSKTLVNTVFPTCYGLGCETVLAENKSSEILERIGGERLPTGGVNLKLPFIWR